MPRARHWKEKVFDDALLVASVLVMVVSVVLSVQLARESSTMERAPVVPFVEFFLLFLTGVAGVRLWRRENR
ncbi:MAG: hypothetical protein Kow0069_20760 [Promethearchaeota archaeon]